MYLPIPPQPDCVSAWRAAVAAVDAQPGDSAYNVLIDITDPLGCTGGNDPRVAIVDDCPSSKHLAQREWRYN